MYIDFIINGTDINEAEAKNDIQELLKIGQVNSITIPYYLIKSIKPLLQKDGGNIIDFSCLVDYPLGISDAKTRQLAVTQAIKAGVNTIDICMPQNLAANRKYDKIREDIKNICDICLEHNIKPRYILEYRMFDHHCLKKICEIFEVFQIYYVFPSTGYFLDNLADNIIASVFLHQNSKNLKIICTGNAWNNKHFEIINKSGLFGIRTNSIHSLKNFLTFNSSSEKNNGV